MKRSSRLLLSAIVACCAAAVQAASTIKAADLPRLTEGSTGFIGVTESAGMPREAVRWSDTGTSGIPLRAGEASTYVNGRPNLDPNAPGNGGQPMGMAGRSMADELRTMGGAHRGPNVSDAPANAHRQWGTPE